MKILIRFGDNDFSTVLQEFGRVLTTDSSREWNPEKLTKANIVRWFNSLAPVLYEVVQARSYTREDDQGFNPMEYLYVTESRVFIGDEVETKMYTWASWGNGDAVLIDFGGPHVPPSVTIV